MRSLIRWMVLVCVALLAACGGGGGEGPVAPAPGAAALRADPGECRYEHVYVTVTAVRLLRDDAAGARWIELAPAQPRRIDLQQAPGALLQTLGIAPLPEGHYARLRLLLDGSEGANAVQPAGGTLSPLDVPGGAHAGLKLDGDVLVPAGAGGDLSLADFDACAAIGVAGQSGRFLLGPVAAMAVVLAFAVVREERVNTTTAGDRMYPAIARLADGGHVVAWLSTTHETAGPWPTRLCTRRYGPDGSAVGGEVCVGSGDAFSSKPAIAALVDGGYVVAWVVVTDATSADVRAQRFDTAGMPSGPELAVNTITEREQWSPAAAGLAGGGFVIAWDTNHQGAFDVFARLYGPDGTPAGAEQRVTSAVYPPGSFGWDHAASVLPLKDGGYAITWRSEYRERGPSIYWRHFTANGSALGAEQPLSSQDGSWELIAVGDGFLMTFGRADGFLRAQRYAFDGTAIGPEVMPYPEETVPPGCRRYVPWETACSVSQQSAGVAPLDDGGYVLSWYSYTIPYHDPSLWLRRYAADDTPLGPATQVLDGTRMSAIAARGDGGFVIAWEARDQTGRSDIFERQY